MTIRGVILLIAALTAAGKSAGWTDRGEYDLVMAIRSEAAAHKRVELLDRWKEKYPGTELRQARLELYLAAYQALGDRVRMLQAAREMLAAQPDNAVGVYWCTLLTPEVKDSTPDVLESGEKSARLLLAGQDRFPAPQKQAAELLAHRTLGWVAWQRGDYAAAETEFHAYLEKNPKSGEIAVWMGLVSGLEKDAEKQSAALWLLERAATLRGEGALSDDQRRPIGALADRLYTAYHGDGDGLEDLKTAVAAATFPPAGFHIETAAAVATRRADEELARTNPELAAWMKIRRQLDAPDGEKYFADTLHSAPLPRLKGVVMRSSPEAKPSQIVLAMSQPLEEDVVLKVSAPFANAAAPGTEIGFEGAADSFTKQPFSLTVIVDREKITGWPEPPAANPKPQR